MFPGGVTSCGCLCPLPLPTLASPVHAWVASSCMGTDAIDLFLHMNVAGFGPGFGVNHNLVCTLWAFVLVGRGKV